MALPKPELDLLVLGAYRDAYQTDVKHTSNACHFQKLVYATYPVIFMLHPNIQMSIDLDWGALDDTLASTVADLLNRAVHSTPLPSYVGEISINSFAFGDVDPDIQLLDIRDISHDFAHEDDSIDLPSNQSEHSEAAHQPAPSLQMHIRVAYSGNMRIGLTTSLLINVPSPLFMSLPLSLTVTDLAFNGTFIVAYDGARRQVHVSIMDPAQDPTLQESDDDAMSYRSFERVRPSDRLLTDLVVESEVGQSDKHVLRNVGKVEKFILDLARSALENELIWPAYQTILF